MANLETLELTIASNSESATQGIGNLIRSLSALSTAVGKSVAGLVKLNAELKTLKGYGALRLPTAGAKSASNAVRKGAGEYDIAHNNGRGVDVSKLKFPNAKSPEAWNSEFNERADKYMSDRETTRQNNIKYRQRIKEEAIAAAKAAEEQKKAFQQMIQAEKEAMNIRGQETQDIMEQSTKLDLLMMKQEALKMETISLAKEGKLTAKQIAERSIQYQKLSDDIHKLQDKMSQTKEESNNLAKGTQVTAKVMKASIKGITKSASGLLSTIGRIFKTMLIRQAIRKLLQAAKEGLDNYYMYSRKMGGAFASSMDKATSKWNQIKNQIGAGLGTALNAVLPILNAIASAALVAFNAITALFALIGGQTTYSRAVEGMDSYADSIKGAGSAAKEWLATFDELNVMTSNSGGGGGAAVKDYANMFEEVALPQWMLEWKPIIEAVLAGTLGAIILPKIWEWIKKIFGLFSGSAADTALNLLNKITGNGNNGFNMPGLGDAATNMVTFGGGAAAAAVALPTVYEYVDKIVKALDGVSLIGSLIGVLTQLVTKAVTAIPVPITLDTKDYDEFVKKHDKWVSEIGKKKVQVVYDFSLPSLVAFTAWLLTVGKKKVQIVYENDDQFTAKLKLWLTTKSVKTIDIKYNDDNVFIAKLNIWLSIPATKKINISVNHTAESQKTIEELNDWVKKKETKSIIIDVGYSIKSLIVAAIQVWTKAQETKGILLNIAYDALSYTMAAINYWVTVKETKTINISLVDNGAISAIDSWVDTTPTKYIDVKIKEDSGSKVTNDFWYDFNNIPIWEFFDKYLVNPIKMTIFPEADSSATRQTRNEIEKGVSNIYSEVSAYTKWIKGYPNNLSRDVNNQYGTVSAYAWFVRGALANLIMMVEACDPVVYAEVKGTGIQKLANDIKDALSTTITLRSGGDNVGTISMYAAASGGLFSAGDIFVANENGTQEMIGSFGNKTGVANQREIVAGISRGVADANREQNALLREQNNLLTNILNKDSSVRISASAALGRVARQSLDMYGSMVGG